MLFTGLLSMPTASVEAGSVRKGYGNRGSLRGIGVWGKGSTMELFKDGLRRCHFYASESGKVGGLAIPTG